MTLRHASYFLLMAVLLVLVGVLQSWSVAMGLLNMCLISAILALGVNIQWGYAGLFSVGTMGFVALGGLAVVLTSMPPVHEAWSAGGLGVLGGLAIGVLAIIAAVQVHRRMAKGWARLAVQAVVVIGGFFLYRAVLDPAVDAIEGTNTAVAGYLGGAGMPVILSWVVGGLLAAGAAWVIGKVSLGLRSDYLAIATLGISETIVAIMKNEDWLSRGVRNVNGLPRPVPYEVNLQNNPDFVAWAQSFGFDAVEGSSIFVKACYAVIFVVVLALIMWLSERAWNSPWGRMMRAIRDNETAAKAMGKDVKKRHLQVFILGSAVCGIAGAMLVTLDGLLTPATYQPLRFTFLIWVMVIVGGSGNNWGAVLGGFLIWFLWIEVEPIGIWAITNLTAAMPEDSGLRAHLLDSAAHVRLLTMGIILLLVLRFAPRGLIPER
ncbi:branched-chain amino acid ABC transporter permease [Pararhodobacter sp. CCB-MM2]|uniref:branched-chain amino acid ABC transporter permease n=1 Tax=Pararhodobacter sp. CCB-MM2 TaxID=1786003 RepID=UPI000830B74A|nr:branched-chain amino acid ABC transporter permease [Pararhodobacter sp. CCB-MM2]MCA2011594.1 branched-chain amino acid ABC transporter permease [Cereibacter sphaeroides]